MSTPSPDTAPLAATLRGQTVLVAGGSRHMGLAVARAAAAAGARVIIVGRDPERTERAAELTRADADTDAEVIAASCDVGEPKLLAELLATHQGFDHLVITVSTAARATTVKATGPEAARAPFDNRFWPTYSLLHAAPRFMSPDGSILVTSGSSGRRPQVGYSVYAVLHAALNALTLSAATDLAPLRVNAISPGGIGLGRTQQLIPHPGEARDFAAMAVALMTNPAITATIVDVDGGEFLGTITDR